MKKRDPTRISRSNARCLRPIGAIEQSVLVLVLESTVVITGYHVPRSLRLVREEKRAKERSWSLVGGWPFGAGAFGFLSVPSSKPHNALQTQ